MLYYEQPYLKRVKVSVLKKEGNKYLLSDTILYPGGGGQPPDEGFAICGNEKYKITHIGDLWHEINGECKEKEIEIVLNWERRYTLMRSHTAEHTFFRILENKGAKMGKIALGDVSSIIFYGDITIQDILEAETQTKKLIKENRKVHTFWIEKKDLPNYPEIRIKIERIKDNNIRVVEIEGHDLSACKGVHISSLGEIGDFAIINIRLGKKKEVKFVIGEKAEEYHLKASQKLREIMWKRNLDLEKIEKYIENIENDRETMLKSLREFSKNREFEKESCKDVEIYYSFFPYGEYKVIQRRALEIANHNKAIVIYGIGESNVVCIAFNNELQWAGDLYKNLITDRGGRGGGKGNFLSGSDKNPESFIRELKKIICEKALQLHGDENGFD